MIDNIFNFIFISTYNREWLKKLFNILNSQKDVEQGVELYNKEFAKFLIKNAVKWFVYGFMFAVVLLFVLLYIRPQYPFIIIGVVVALLIILAIRGQIVLRIEE